MGKSTNLGLKRKNIWVPRAGDFAKVELWGFRTFENWSGIGGMCGALILDLVLARFGTALLTPDIPPKVADMLFLCRHGSCWEIMAKNETHAAIAKIMMKKINI